MSAARRVLGGMRAAEGALIVLLVGVIAAAAVLFVRPGAVEAVLGLPPAGQVIGGQGGPLPVRSLDRR